MDVSFIISRTLVYTILSTIVIGVFALIDFVSGKLLGRLGFTIAFEACGALLLALSLHRLLGRVDCLVDALLFRARHLAGLRLEGAAAAVTQSETAKDVDDVLVDEACDALMLASAATFRRDDCGDYIRVKDRGWSAEDANRLSKGDRLIAKLLTERRPLDLMTFHPTSDGLPQGFTQPLLAIPLIARRGIPGVVL